MNHINRLCVLLCTFAFIGMLSSCKKDEPTPEKTIESGDVTIYTGGWYLLNQGNMGTNKASLDYFKPDGTYFSSVFTEVNPTVTLGLGDVANDMKIYGGKLYIAVQGSNLLEVVDARTCKHIKSINLNSPRFITCYNGKVYVSSYMGKTLEDKTELGSVVEVDTLGLDITRRCIVGYNPEEMEVSDGKLYVANSGGYLYPVYSDKLSVVDLNSFAELEQIPLALNMLHVRKTSGGLFYITSKGNYDDVLGSLIVFDPASGKTVTTLDIPDANLCIVGDKCYMYSVVYDENWNLVSKYYIVNTTTHTVVTDALVDASVTGNIVTPYAIAAFENGEFCITDAGTYVDPGTLYYFNADGTLKFSHITGDIPAAIQ